MWRSAYFLMLPSTPLLFVLIWSTGFIAAKFGLPYAPPLTFLSIRYLLSVGCFGLWIVIVRVPWPQGWRQWVHLCVTGMLMHGGYLGGVWIAVKAGMGSGLTALIVGLQPILTALWLSRRSFFSSGHSADSAVSLRQWLGLLLGLMGLLLVVARKLGTTQEISSTSMLATLVALLSITVGTLYQKRFLKPVDVRSANVVQLAAALVLTLPFALLERETIVWEAHFALAMVWSVLVLTLGGSSLFYVLIQRGSTTAVTSLLYLVPPSTALMAWALFNEPITAITLLGTALTALGVGLVVNTKSLSRAKDL